MLSDKAKDILRGQGQGLDLQVKDLRFRTKDMISWPRGSSRPRLWPGVTHLKWEPVERTLYVLNNLLISHSKSKKCGHWRLLSLMLTAMRWLWWMSDAETALKMMMMANPLAAIQAGHRHRLQQAAAASYLTSAAGLRHAGPLTALSPAPTMY